MRALREFWRLYREILEGPGRGLAWAAAGLAAGWWICVPVHELLHAAGCALGGGQVRQVEISPLYGGRWLAEHLPFVVAGGRYAGRLSGFDTHGADGVYALTVCFPYLLTLPSLRIMHGAVRGGIPFFFGLALPLLAAPLISLTGDYLELGSLLLFQVWPGADPALRALISDDLFRLVAEINAGNPGWSARVFAFVSLSQAAGAGLAWITLGLCSAIGASGRGKRLAPSHPE